jgi:hypothetical protein
VRIGGGGNIWWTSTTPVGGVVPNLLMIRHAVDQM